MAAAIGAVEELARRLGLESTKVAWGIHDIVNENMAGAARVHIAERGRDPRDYALLCTGGAGPVHAFSVAGKLGIARVICLPSAGGPPRRPGGAGAWIGGDGGDPARPGASRRSRPRSARWRARRAVMAETGPARERDGAAAGRRPLPRPGA